MGGHLVSIHSEEENDFVADIIGHDKKFHTWIGLQRTEDHDVWRWTDGSAVNFTAWYTNQPDGSPAYKHNCGHAITQAQRPPEN
ncbi:lectin C-type domain protein [Ancylostoma duodenale]|uniref:Lectin C-type domain protein n=1 Tax=Ancylostoma duodenale TaxID=51022 RepID=A0A0C2DQS0_9BILA|nr:lectin C-type domain protein [Ancylostoma duodenale]